MANNSGGIGSKKETALRLRAAAEEAVQCIGLGYDLTLDLRLKYCKNQRSTKEGSRLIAMDDDQVRDISVPGGILVQNVPKSINCDKGERMRFSSDVLAFQQMSEQFNQELSIAGKIPTGHFNAAFEFTGCWQKDAAFTKSLAFDGVFITLYSIALEKSQVTLRDHVKQAVPSSWDPAALARWGKGCSICKAAIFAPLQPIEVQKRLKDVADKRFSDASEQSSTHPEKAYGKEMHATNERGFALLDPSTPSFHSSQEPPIEELHQFLEFQLPRQWAPVFGDVPLGPDRKQQGAASLQFSLMGPKLYVNTDEVDAGNKPVTGLRLYLEGKRSNCLAIHLQHLSSLPKSFQLRNESGEKNNHSSDRRYYEKVQWKSFSHVCTVPVESDDDLSIVTGAHFEVKDSGMKNVLFLRLHFSKVIGATVVKKSEWDGSPALAQKSGIISTLISSRFSTGQKPAPKPSDVNINSALYPEGPPMPAQTLKLRRFVDTTEMTRGPQDSPGYWVVSGARLVVDNGKICLRVKYSLLAVILQDEEVLLQR
ncbi:hypothetical protein DH2020_048720 [Rehmannia glutinosa]|uniref:MACPF domain-containing protein n=1 Tax=Rehmannia glutinosa TaxID=99300 RepID=A0ABR0U5G1_REHGL